MSSLRYKTLLSYLPGMASVVNAFESPHVQNSVYQTLLEALEVKLQSEGLGAVATTSLRDSQRIVKPSANGELTHELVEGESIHSDSTRLSTTSTVF